MKWSRGIFTMRWNVIQFGVEAASHLQSLLRMLAVCLAVAIIVQTASAESAQHQIVDDRIESTCRRPDGFGEGSGSHILLSSAFRGDGNCCRAIFGGHVNRGTEGSDYRYLESKATGCGVHGRLHETADRCRCQGGCCKAFKRRPTWFRLHDVVLSKEWSKPDALGHGLSPEWSFCRFLRPPRC